MTSIDLDVTPGHHHVTLTIGGCTHQLTIADLAALEQRARHATTMASLHRLIRGGAECADACLEE